MSYTASHDGFTIDTNRARLDVDLVHGFLTTTYWATNIPREAVERSIANSLCFGIYDGAMQVGFARVVSDMVHFAYLADVFVLPGYRGRGLGKWLTATITRHPELQTVRRWLLATRDAHGVYAAAGFGPLEEPGRYMTIKKVPPWQQEPTSTAT